MKRTYQILAVTCLALLVIAACRKPNNKRTTDIDPTTVNTGGQPPIFPYTGTQPLSELFKNFRTTPEVICVTAGITQAVSFKKGTRLTFYPKSFRYASGDIVTSGTVCVELVEMYKPGDMIANGATTTTASGELLQSGGQVRIRASKDGQRVYLNKYGIAFMQQAPSNLPMQLFFGNNLNSDSSINWTVADPTLAGTVDSSTSSDTTSPMIVTPPFPPPPYNPFYVFDSCFGGDWINCDRFYNYSGPTHNIRVTIADTSFSSRNTKVCIAFRDINAVARGQFQSFNFTATPYSLFVTKGFPENLQFDVVVMTNKNGKYYYSEVLGQTLSADMEFPIEMEQQSEDYVKAKISAL
jgi:hypothetical protein